MIAMVSPATIFAVLALGVAPALAMGGGGNLRPDESPYAILAPQTLGLPTPDGRAAFTGGEPAAAPAAEAPHHVAKPRRRHPAQ